ncbi:MAG: hypothetical protein KF812_05490 [Fimbriimonadaceae bacterium]|nr:hypothetical protein [Fimbriimonadaceae bacterium]
MKSVARGLIPQVVWAESKMNYWVIAADGNKYGPADLSVLNTWIAEGRLSPDSELEVVETSQRVRARDVAGLVFPTAQPTAQSNPYAPQSPSVETPPQSSNPYATPDQGQQPGQVYNPYSNPYPRQMQFGGDDGSQDVKNAYLYSILGFFCCGPAIIAGVISANKGVQKGNPGAPTAKTVSIVLLCLWLLGLIVQVVMIANGAGF